MGNTKTHKNLKNKPLTNPKSLSSTSYTHKNFNQYNDESTHISTHSKAYLNTDNQQLTNDKKVYLEGYVCL